jgi:hypothetical protein
MSTGIFGKIAPLSLLALLHNGVTVILKGRNKMESFHKSCLLKDEAEICCLGVVKPAALKKCFIYMHLLVDIVQRSCLFLGHSQNCEKNYYRPVSVRALGTPRLPLDGLS